MLNKITGCKPRTVPPLYVPMARSLTKVSHWDIPGKAEPPQHPQICKHESEDLRNALFSHIPRFYGMVRLSQKNGCGALSGAAVFFFMEGNL